MVNYGGDEVGALVVDVGSSSVRVGHAGDDAPKAIVPSNYGFLPATPDADVSMNDGTGESEPSKPQRYFIGQSGPSTWRAGMEIGNPTSEGLITDFTATTNIIKYAISDVMRCDPSEQPILCTEPSWNTPGNRERMAEIMFEEFHVPAFYIANTGVLNTFAAGKGSALVIDVGASMASVTPVVDGFVLRKGLAYSTLPKLVHAHARHILVNPTQARRGIELFSHHLILNKAAVDPGTLPHYTLRQDRLSGTTESWRLWAENREVDEWTQSVAGVLEQGWNDQVAASRGARQYEFPTGFNTYFGPERFTIGEHYFYHSQQLVASNPNLPKTIPAMISESLRACDPEMRQVLMANVVLTGGGSMLHGFADRLTSELIRTFPHMKIHAPGNPIERKYGGWLGGSILGSLGTFHQLWISQEEWQEHGRPIVGQRCK